MYLDSLLLYTWPCVQGGLGQGEWQGHGWIFPSGNQLPLKFLRNDALSAMMSQNFEDRQPLT